MRRKFNMKMTINNEIMNATIYHYLFIIYYHAEGFNKALLIYYAY